MHRSITRALIATALIGGLLVLAGLPGASSAPAGDTERYSFGYLTPSGWERADGSLFDGDSGWVAPDGQKRQCGTRNVNPNKVLDSFCHATTRYELIDGVWNPIVSPATWKKIVANGTYDVTVVVGEAAFHSRRIAHSVQAEGVSVHDRVATTKASPFSTATRRVTVSDGTLDLSFVGGTHTKIVSLELTLVSTVPTTASSTTASTAAPTSIVPTTAAPTTAAPTTVAPTTAAPTTAAPTTAAPTTAAPTTAAPTTTAPPITAAPVMLPDDGSTRYSFGNTAPPAPWIQAHSSLYGGGHGWVVPDGQKRQCGTRNVDPDPVLDTFCHATTRYLLDGGTWTAIASPATWKADIANGIYDVTVTVGEAQSHPSSVAHSVQAEGVPVHNRVKTSSATPFRTATVTIQVSDGMLDLAFEGGTKTKVVSVVITPSNGTPMTAPPTTTAKPTATTAKATTTTTAAPTGGTGGTGKQFTLYDVTGIIQDFNKYAQPSFNWPGSGSMTGPTNYAGGNAYVRFQVVTKPTNIPMVAQLCFWFQYTPGSFTEYEETCSPKSQLQFTSTGVLYADLGAPASWWQQNGSRNRNGVFDWSKKPHVTRIFLKDDKTGTLFIEERCGSACWSGGNAADHLPVKMNVELIFVEKGKSFTPPADWKNSPWS